MSYLPIRIAAKMRMEMQDADAKARDAVVDEKVVDMKHIIQSWLVQLLRS